MPIIMTKAIGRRQIKATLCAYYPYNIASSNGNITLTSQLYSDDADFCYQTGKTASSESGDVAFYLNHEYAKIAFIFKRKESYRGNWAVRKISISGKNILSSNTLDIKTGSYDSGTSGAVTVNPVISSISSGGTANCYILAPGATMQIPENVKGNGDANAVAGTGFDVHHTAASVGILWETTQNLISLSGFTTESSKIQITANSETETGNAVIAAYFGTNITENILWSWHIWITDYNPDSSIVQNGNIYIYTIANTNGSYTWMDRNLGATTVTPATTTTLEILYQWGRKDPFTGANNYYLSESNVYTSLPIYNANGTLLTEESGTYSSASICSDKQNRFYLFHFNTNYIKTDNKSYRSGGFSVRRVKE